MRRSTADVDQAARLRPIAQAVARLAASEIEPRIAALEPFATPARRARLEENIARRVQGVTVVLDAFHDPHNGAAIVRTADSFGIQTVHAIERYQSFLAARSVARGSERWVDVVGHRDVSALERALPRDHVEWIAATADGELVPEDLAKLERPFALVIGSERDGLGADLSARCSRSVRVPMRGYAESLNVSVTTGILLYEAMRGRGGDMPEETRRRLYLRGLVQSLERAHDLLEAAGVPLRLAPTQLPVGIEANLEGD